MNTTTRRLASARTRAAMKTHARTVARSLARTHYGDGYVNDLNEAEDNMRAFEDTILALPRPQRRLVRKMLAAAGRRDLAAVRPHMSRSA